MWYTLPRAIMFAAILSMASSAHVPVASFGPTEHQGVNDTVFNLLMKLVVFCTIYGIVRAVMDAQNLVKWILGRMREPAIVPVVRMPNMIHQVVPMTFGDGAEAEPVPRPKGLPHVVPTAVDPATVAEQPAAAPEPKAADAAGGEAASARGGARKTKGQQRTHKSQDDQLCAARQIDELCAGKSRQLQLTDWPMDIIDKMDVACDCGKAMIPRICHAQANAIPFYGCPDFHRGGCRHTKAFQSVHGYGMVLLMLEQAIISYEARSRD